MTFNAAAAAALSESVNAVAALDAADQLGVLDALAVAPADAGSLAVRCQITVRGATVLLAALDSMGIAEAVPGNQFRISDSMVNAIRMMGQMRLADVIKNGHPLARTDISNGAVALYAEIVEPLAAMLAPVARAVAKIVDPPPGPRILDLGAGAAPWSIALAQRHPECTVTALDLPEVIPATRRAVAAAGLQHRFTVTGGDFLTTTMPTGIFDFVILGNICHLLDPDANRTLFDGVRSVLRPRGRVAIIDILPGTSPGARRSVDLYALGLLTRTGSGGVYPEATYRRWLTEAGFSSVTVRAIGGNPRMSLITAFSGHDGFCGVTDEKRCSNDGVT